MKRLVIVASILCAAATAVAQPTPAGQPVAPPDPARERALPMFQRGLELVQGQRWSEALEQFVQAHAIYPSPIILYNIGYTQRALGEYVEALATLRRFLAQELDGVAASRREPAEGYVRELESRIAHLVIRVPEEVRANAEVLVDGATVVLEDGVADVALDPGRHTLRVQHEGYRQLFEDRDLDPGERVEVSVELRRLPARLVVSSNVPRADVWVDGRAIGRVPYDAEIDPGRHRVEVRAEGYVTHRATLNLSPGGTSRVQADLDLQPVPLTARWWFWTGIGIVVVGAAVATYFVTRPEPEPPPYQDGSLDWVIGR